MERSILITTMLAGVLFLEILLLMGRQLPEGDAIWANLLGFVVALQFFAMSLTRAARSLTSITRFYPWVNPFYEFLEVVAKQSKPPVTDVATKIQNLDPQSPGVLRVSAGRIFDIVSAGDFDRLTLSMVLDSLGPGLSQRPWAIQELNETNRLSVREHFGVPVHLDLESIAQSVSVPDPLREVELTHTALDKCASDVTGWSADRQAIIGTLGCLCGGADVVFYSARLWQNLSVACREWIEQTLGDRFLFNVHQAHEFSPVDSSAGAILVESTQVTGWCRQAYLVECPDLYRNLKTERVRTPAFDALDEEEELG